MFEVTYLA